MTKEMRKESGLQFEKNSVECRHNTNERGVSMPVPKEKRDYKAEYARNKERIKQRSKAYKCDLTNADNEIFVATLDRFNCKTLGEFIRKILHGELIVSEIEK